MVVGCCPVDRPPGAGSDDDADDASACDERKRCACASRGAGRRGFCGGVAVNGSAREGTRSVLFLRSPPIRRLSNPRRVSSSTSTTKMDIPVYESESPRYARCCMAAPLSCGVASFPPPSLVFLSLAVLRGTILLAIMKARIACDLSHLLS